MCDGAQSGKVNWRLVETLSATKRRRMLAVAVQLSVVVIRISRVSSKMDVKFFFEAFQGCY
jgi:hypothetical protein